MATAATIAIKLEAQTATLKKGFADAQRQVKGFAGGVKRSMRLLQIDAALNIGRRMGSAVTELFNNIQGSLDKTAGIADFADRLGMKPQDLMSLRQATEQFGGSAEALNMGLQRLTKNATRASLGQKEFRTALERLGISVTKFARLDPYEKFLRFADAIRDTRNEAMQLEAVVKMMDTEGAALTHTLRQGSDALRSYMDRMRESTTLSNEAMRAAQEAAAYNLEFLARYEVAWANLSVTMAEANREFLRIKISAIEMFTDLWKWSEKFWYGLYGMEPPRASSTGKGRVGAELATASDDLRDASKMLENAAAVTSTSMEGFRALMEAQNQGDSSDWESAVVDRLDRLIALTRDRAEIRKFAL